MTIKVLVAATESFIRYERGRVAADCLAGNGVVVTLENAAGFAVNDYVVIGAEGSEQAELTKVTAVGGQAITVNLLLPHLITEPVVKYRYNQRKFYGSLTAGGSYAELTGSPVTISVNDPQGTLIEYTTGEGYLYFKSTYWNSTTSEESDIADATAVLADDTVRYCSIAAIKKQAGLFDNPYVSDGDVEIYRKRAENEVDSYLNARYILPLINASGTAEIPFVIENVATLLAAGYLDYKEFGKDGQGVKWLGEARGFLKSVQKQGGVQIIGSDHLEMQTHTNSNGVASYPASVDNDNGPDRKFTMRQRF